MPAPKPEPNCNSWVIVRRTTRVPVCEIYGLALADHIADNEPAYEVLTAAQWLAEFNRSVRK